MVLLVEFEKFPQAVREHAAGARVYLSVRRGQTLASAADPWSQTIVQALTSLSLDEAQAELLASGLRVLRGAWLQSPLEADESKQAPMWVAAVAYVSAEQVPGLWVESFPEEPTTADVLTALIEEYQETGEVTNLSVDEFRRYSFPNIVILGPEELERFLRKRVEQGGQPGTVRSRTVVDQV